MEIPLQKLLLALTPCLFAADLLQGVLYLREADAREGGEHLPHSVCGVCFAAFFAAMMFALLAPSLPMMWVAVELTTLASAPLIAYRRTRESLEAMWKYLLICSIGIGLALFGTMLVLHAQTTGDVRWYKSGFAFVLAGYGTKTGLAPFHVWLPDAHSEAPAPVSALLSGALLNCSFFSIVRFRAVMPADAAPFCDTAMLALGVLSVATAAVFMVRQTDYKRLLAYSSVEHMGLAAVLFALSGLPSVAGARADLVRTALLAHVATHSLTKTMLFHTAGNLLLAFGTRTIAAVQGLGVTMKGHAALWLAGVFLICGLPPSVLFLSELGLVCAAPVWISAVVLVLLFVVFAAMTKVALAMTMGRPARLPDRLPRRLAVVPTLLAVALALGGTACCLAIAR
ncbi:MAG: proton-conducting transporter membrane subunit [Kiritimatiellia bacterium]